MALIDTVQTTSVTVPAYIRQLGTDANGKLPTDILRSWGRSGFMFEPVSYAMEALFLAAFDAVFVLDNVGDYRTYANQVALFLSRYQQSPPLPGRPTKVWNGVIYYQKPGTAMAATPGTSNHGLGLALDVCLYRAVGMSDALLIWMRDHAPAFGFGLESHSERWHWHWRGNNAIPQLVVDVLAAHEVTIPSLARYGFAVPSPTPPPAPQEDLMPINVNKPAYDSRIVDGPFQQGTGRNIKIPDAKGHKWAELGLVAVEANGGGFFAISNTGVKPGTAALNVEPGGMISGQRSGMFFLNGDGAVDVYFDGGGVDGVSCHLVIDVAVVGD